MPRHSVISGLAGFDMYVAIVWPLGSKEELQPKKNMIDSYEFRTCMILDNG